MQNMMETFARLADVPLKEDGIDEGADPSDEARRMIDDPDKLYQTLAAMAKRAMDPAFDQAQSQARGLSKAGGGNTLAPDLFNHFLVPALRKYAEDVTRAADAMAKKFK